MCGIIGLVSKKEFSIKNDLLLRLKRLEYRGYDSVGYATNTGIIEKKKGQITEFMKNIKGNAKVAIAHTRWATHGGVNKKNAHPHYSEHFMIVHNGIIENFDKIKKRLANKGHKFNSDTDSEIIAHYFEQECIKSNNTVESTIRKFIKNIKGTFAVLLIKKGDNKIYAFKRESPLVLGIAKRRLYLASDIYAFSDKTNNAIFFEDDEYAIVCQDKYVIYNKNGRRVSKKAIEFKWGQKESNKKKYPHYMIKEIKEEPIVAEHLLHSLRTDQKTSLINLKKAINKAKRVFFIAAGTSFNAAMVGNHFLNQFGIKSSCWIASEFDVPRQVNRNSLIIVISQSGETMDYIEAIKFAKQKSEIIQWASKVGEGRNRLSASCPTNSMV